MTEYRYSLYGLQLLSELPLPGLRAGSAPADVVIRWGRVPDELPGAVKRGVHHQAAPGRLRLASRGIARYLVTRGREVVVEADPEADEAAVRASLLGTVMKALLLQRGVLPLHASAVESDGHCIAFAGDSGHGKSTLAAAFHQSGYRVLTDDVLVVREANGTAPTVYPTCPELKLWVDAIDKLEIEASTLRKTHAGSQKSGLRTGKEKASEPLPVSHVYVLNITDRDLLEIEPITGMNKLGALTRYTCRRHFLDDPDGKPGHFRLCVALSRHARVARVIRPRAGFKLDELVQMVESDFSVRTASSDSSPARATPKSR